MMTWKSVKRKLKQAQKENESTIRVYNRPSVKARNKLTSKGYVIESCWIPGSWLIRKRF